MVEHLPPHLKIEGSSPATGMGTEKKLGLMDDRSSCTVVEYLTHYLKVEGSNPSTVHRREKICEKEIANSDRSSSTVI